MNIIRKPETRGKKFFIVGAAHSGTTILYKMIAFHPSLAWFCQFSQRNGKIPGRFYLPFSNAYKRNLRRVFKHSWRKGGDHFWIPRPGEGREIWKWIFQSEDPIKRKRILTEIIDDELAGWKLDNIVFKNPDIGTEVKFLSDSFPEDSYFIHIIRDGRAVILSDLNKFLRHYSEKSALNHAIKYWNDYLQTMNEYGRQSNWRNIIEIRYEDFIRDTHAYLRKILSFFELDPDGFNYQWIPEKLKSSNAKWINKMNSGKLNVIVDKAEKFLKHYRYD